MATHSFTRYKELCEITINIINVKAKQFILLKNRIKTCPAQFKAVYYLDSQDIRLHKLKG